MRYKRIYFLVLCLIFILTGCQKAVSEEATVERTGFVLGTVVTVAIYDHGSEALLDQVFDRLLAIENLMSANLDASEIGQINLNAGVSPVTVSDETLTVIDKGLDYGALSGGAFDITMEPVVALWQIGTDDAHVPDAADLEEAVSKVDYQLVQVDHDAKTVYLPEVGMGIDLGGIAKGYAADEIVTLLKEAGVERAMLNLGGNVYAMGEKSDGTPWKIGIQAPFDERNDYFGVAPVSNATVVTSGPYERYFEENGKRYHHIFDSETGWPVENDLASVSIIAEASMDGDALSTTLFVLGVERGLPLIESLPGVECIFVTTDKTVTVSSGLVDQFVLSDDAYHFAQ